MLISEIKMGMIEKKTRIGFGIQSPINIESPDLIHLNLICFKIRKHFNDVKA